MSFETQEEAEAEALRRFAERAEEFRLSLEEAFLEALPGNHAPAEAVLLAHLMTATDGFHYVHFVRHWDRRPKMGWTTGMAYMADITPELPVTFATETRYDDHFRQLAILIDRNRPGERLPAKRKREAALMALDCRVVVFTELEILSSPEACRERVEGILSDMMHEVLIDAEILSDKSDSSPPS